MKELIDYLSGRINVSNKAMIEKDIILHRLLGSIVADVQFKGSFVFKGGTCLTKCYLGYYRFSEDLDFTYIKQDDFKGLSQKETRRFLSSKIDELLFLLKKASEALGLDFRPEKSNTNYIEYGGSNKFVTFKLWYKSHVIKVKQFVKIQINFVEEITESIEERQARSLYSDIPYKEMLLLFPEYVDVIKGITLKCYSLKEILYEKIRAILTRRSVKSRDFIDAYLIGKSTDVVIEAEKDKIIGKIRFMLRYDKYVQNLSEFSIKNLVLEDTERLLIKPVDHGFSKFMDRFPDYLKDLSTQL